MAVPPCGFWPRKCLSALSPFAFVMSFTHAVALRTSKRCASLVVIASVICCSGVMSSMIQMLRPCVPRTRSLSRGCTRTSSTRTEGRPVMNRFHSLPPVSEM